MVIAPEIWQEVEWIDMHVHADQFKDAELTNLHYRENKIAAWSVSMDYKSYSETQQNYGENPFIYVSFGIHPWQVKNWDHDWQKLECYLNGSEIIGEVGIDYFWEHDPNFDVLQYELFDFIVGHAHRQKKWINIHTKGAEKEVYQILKKHEHEKAIIHWYSGPKNWFKKYIDLGCMFTFGVELPYNLDLQSMLQCTPGNNLLAETDGPGGIEWLKKCTAVPQDIKDVYAYIGQYRNESLASVQDQIKRNVSQILFS